MVLWSSIVLGTDLDEVTYAEHCSGTASIAGHCQDPALQPPCPERRFLLNTPSLPWRPDSPAGHPSFMTLAKYRNHKLSSEHLLVGLLPVEWHLFPRPQREKSCFILFLTSVWFFFCPKELCSLVAADLSQSWIPCSKICRKPNKIDGVHSPATTIDLVLGNKNG